MMGDLGPRLSGDLPAAAAAVVDLRDTCPPESEALACPSPSRPWVVLRNDSSLLPHARDLQDARARLGECVVFAFLDRDVFSAGLAPLVLTAARVFPHVAFARAEGHRAGYLLGSVLPKSFPVVVHVSARGHARVYEGSHEDLDGLLAFVAERTGMHPLSWHPELATPRNAQLSPALLPAADQVVDFLRPPPREREPLHGDPVFVLAAIFLAASALLNALRACSAWRLRRRARSLGLSLAEPPTGPRSPVLREPWG